MKAMLLNHITNLADDHSPLTLTNLPEPVPGNSEVLIKVAACGVCHTELDEIEGRTPPPRLPIIPGHQVVGRVAAFGPGDQLGLQIGDRVGVAWIYGACGECEYCRSGRENLCASFQATGRDANGGYAEYLIARAAFVHRIPETFTDVAAAPLLCAGAVGYRSLALTQLADGQPLGLTGFGASGHLVLQLARHRYPHSPVFVFARSPREREFARDLGAAWAGDTAEAPPERCAAIIDTTPVWTPVVAAMNNLAAGGRLVINAIRKEDADRDALRQLDYSTHLWQEKEIKSVANVTRRDVREFLQAAAEMNLTPETQTFALAEANRALLEMKRGHVRGGKVLVI